VTPEAPPSEIISLADPPEISPGSCALLVWDARPGFGATLDGDAVNQQGNQQVCPAESTTYMLEVEMGTSMERRVVEVTVTGVEKQPQAGAEPDVVEQVGRVEPVMPGPPAYQSARWSDLGGPPGGLGYDIRMQPDKPDTMYVTDGFTGFFKSTDGGANWFPINTGIEPFPGVGDGGVFRHDRSA
jgi:hypothetical protein